MRSLIDYIFFAINNINTYQLDQIEKIQNKVIRLIFNKKYDHPTEALRKIANTEKIKDRLKSLLENYFIKASNNPLVTQFQKEYIESYNDHLKEKSCIKTPLGDFIASFLD